MEVDAQTIRDSVEAKKASEDATTAAGAASLAAEAALSEARAANERTARLQEDFDALAEAIVAHQGEAAGDGDGGPTTEIDPREPDPTDPPADEEQPPADPPADPPAERPHRPGILW